MEKIVAVAMITRRLLLEEPESVSSIQFEIVFGVHFPILTDYSENIPHVIINFFRGSFCYLKLHSALTTLMN